MRIVDDLIFSPKEIVPERQEFSLSEMGLSVTGFQVSEMGTDATKVQGMHGPIIVATKPKERVATITLEVKGDADASLATAAYRLQLKLGQIEEVGDWLKRVPYVGDFAGPVACKVHPEVSLGNMGQWQAGECPEVAFQLLIGAEWFDIAEEDVTDDLEIEQVGRATIVTIPPSRGTTRGLERLRIKDSGGGHLRGLLYAKECHDAPEDLEDPTAMPVYNCADLTPKGGASVKTVSGLEVVEASLTAGWLTILDSEIDGVGHMTHVGGRRFWLRVQNPESADAELRLRYRVLGATDWEDCRRAGGINIVAIPHHGGDYQYYDMGQVKPEPGKLGDKRLQWQVLGRAQSGSGKVRLHQVELAPTEQYMVIKQPYVAPAADLVLTKSPGTVEDKSGIGTVEWKEAAKAKASDNSYAKATFPEVTAEKESHYLWFKNFGFSLPEGATPLQALASIERSASGVIMDSRVRLLKAGAVQSEDRSGLEAWPSADALTTYTWNISDWLFSDVNDSGFGFVLAVKSGGIATAQVDLGTLGIYYTEAEGEDRICFASRSMEIRSDVVARQHPTDDVWGHLIPDGFYPYDSPGAIEGKPSRVLLIPTHGDFGEIADVGAPEPAALAEIAVESYMRRPAYHLAREAAS